MRFSDRRGDDIVDRLLDDPDSAHPGEFEFETASFLRALRAAVPEAPDPALEAELVPALAVEAHSATLDAMAAGTVATESVRASSAARWRMRLAVVAAAVAALPALMAGLAYAGVELPQPVDDAFDAAGVDLPNQGSGSGADGAAENGAKDDRGSGGDAAGAGAQIEPTGGGEGEQDSGKATGETGGKGNANANGKPDHAGPEATPPGHGGTPTGQGGVPPGNAGVPPGGGSDGSAAPPPDAAPSVTPPGHGGSPPGQAKPK